LAWREPPGLQSARDGNYYATEPYVAIYTRQRLSLVFSNGHYFVTAPRTPAGWLRK